MNILLPYSINKRPLPSKLALALGMLVSICFLNVTNTASAQNLRNRILDSTKDKNETRERRPNDQIEGTIWSYKSTKYKSKLEKGEKEPKLDGKFRVEGTALFAVEKTVKIKSRTDRKTKLRDLARGSGTKIKVPDNSTPERIGEYVKTKDGKIRFTLYDENGLNGTMIAWKKKDTNGVWLAEYYQKDGKKTTGKWMMELRAIQD